MSVFAKARELGNQIRETQEYQELERVGLSLKDDPEARKIIQKVQEAQGNLDFSQKSGVEPSQEQMNQFNQLREQMMTNLTVRNYLKAQEEFNNFMKQVNETITSGITGEDVAKGKEE